MSKLSEHKKLLLIEQAKSGVSKIELDPHLCQCLRNYTNEHGLSFDAEFKAEVKAIRPEWFDRAISMQQKRLHQQIRLIKAADRNEPKPARGSELRKLFNNFCKPSYLGYSESFINALKKTAPHWFLRDDPRIIKTQKKKAEMLELFKINPKRPNDKTQLGSNLRDYVSPSSNAYDPIFASEVRTLRPNWFKA
jgi:hypothetical protein